MSTTPSDTANPTPAADARQRAKTAGDGEGIRLNEAAAQKVREFMAKTDSPDTQYLYMGVKGGGCGGLSYILDLRDEQGAPVGDTDEVFLSHDIMIVCDLKSYIVGNLAGTTIGFEDGMTGKGFTFNNPNAKNTCGCGSSYSA